MTSAKPFVWPPARSFVRGRESEAAILSGHGIKEEEEEEEEEKKKKKKEKKKENKKKSLLYSTY